MREFPIYASIDTVHIYTFFHATIWRPSEGQSPHGNENLKSVFNAAADIHDLIREEIKKGIY